MALLVKTNPWKDAATAEGITAAEARAVRAAMPNPASIKAWVATIPAAGVDEAAMRAAWEGLTNLTDAQVRVVMRVASDLSGGDFQP